MLVNRIFLGTGNVSIPKFWPELVKNKEKPITLGGQKTKLSINLGFTQWHVYYFYI